MSAKTSLSFEITKSRGLPQTSNTIVYSSKETFPIFSYFHTEQLNLLQWLLFQQFSISSQWLIKLFSPKHSSFPKSNKGAQWLQ